MSDEWKSKHINDWSCQELQDWIISIKLGNKNQKIAIACISDQGITGEDFNTIEDKTEIKDAFPDIHAMSANKIWAAFKNIRLAQPSTSKKEKYETQTWQSKHINNWSCKELQEWMGSIGLNSNHQQIIQHSIASQGIEGEDFNSMDSVSDICDSFDGIHKNICNKIYVQLIKVREMNKQEQKHNEYNNNNYNDYNNDNNNNNTYYNDNENENDNDGTTSDTGCVRVYGGGAAKQQGRNLQFMIDWLISEGAKFDKLYIKCYGNEHHSVHATTRLFKDESICFIPHNCIITAEIAMASTIGLLIRASQMRLNSAHSWFAAYVLQEREKHQHSKWCYYISILPQKHSTIPLLLDTKERKKLTGSFSLQKIDDRLHALSVEYESICSAVPSFARFSLNDFIWARCIVITRIYGLVINGAKTSGLVAFADLFNPRKRTEKEARWIYSELRRGFVVTANFDISHNDQVFEGYGRKCNSRFFVNYGFCLEKNIDNEAVMVFQLDKDDVLYEQKAAYLGFGFGEIVSKAFQIAIQYRKETVREAFAFLRILCASADEFRVIRNRGMFNNVGVASRQTEKKVLQCLSAAARESLQGFATSLEFDNELLENEYEYPQGSMARNIILMRRGEKEVLHFYMNLRKTCVPLLETETIDLRWQLRQEMQNVLEMDYINDVVIPLIQRK